MLACFWALIKEETAQHEQNMGMELANVQEVNSKYKRN
jgi:hypothetical protein